MKTVLLLLLVSGSTSWAFPDMVRHGYVHCISCHTNQVGGGLLNEYGRSLSKEVLSQLTLGGRPVAEGDEAFLYGTVKMPKRLLLGGDIRLLQVFTETKEASKGRFLVMQVDLDSSYDVTSRLRAFLSLGRVEPQTSDPTAQDYIASPRHGLELLFSDPEAVNRWALRLGRFMPAFGIGFAEHTFVTRRHLGMMPGQERYAAELSWNNDRTSVLATALFAQADATRTRPEKGGVLQASQAIGDASKIGLSFYESDTEQSQAKFQRQAYGFFSHIAFDKNWYGLLEVDRVKSPANTWGMVEVFKLGYEVHQGWHVFAVHEFANLDMKKSDPKFEGYSIGTQWFPRPHWDILTLYRLERNSAVRNSFDQVIWLVGHFYL